MFKTRRRRLAIVRNTRFCEACAEVCTPECRSHAHLDRARTAASQHQFPVIR